MVAEEMEGGEGPQSRPLHLGPHLTCDHPHSPPRLRNPQLYVLLPLSSQWLYIFHIVYSLGYTPRSWAFPYVSGMQAEEVVLCSSLKERKFLFMGSRPAKVTQKDPISGTTKKQKPKTPNC